MGKVFKEITFVHPMDKGMWIQWIKVHPYFQKVLKNRKYMGASWEDLNASDEFKKYGIMVLGSLESTWKIEKIIFKDEALYFLFLLKEVK